MSSKTFFNKLIKLISHPLPKNLAKQRGLTSGSCRFSPTCSKYARQAISRHGIIKGGFFALKRVLKCHPLYSGGYDLSQQLKIN